MTIALVESATIMASAANGGGGGGAQPAMASEAVLVESQDMPEGSVEVNGYVRTHTRARRRTHVRMVRVLLLILYPRALKPKSTYILLYYCCIWCRYDFNAGFSKGEAPDIHALLQSYATTGFQAASSFSILSYWKSSQSSLPV